ncbi:MAG TPA: hypothetical protein VGP26_11155 [Actinophytocola sp.]|nr:hypothetical protein [Actinophytocola sp.]
MRNRSALLLLAVSLVLAGCGPDQPDEPGAIRFTEVRLPAGAKPMVLTPVGDALLIGVRRDGRPVVPGLLRRDADGKLADVPVNPAGMYGEEAFWYSIAADASKIVAIGGKTGGAHGNVRWSTWDGSAAALTEKPQPFSTFGGYGGGDLVDAVLTPAGPALIGTWQNPTVGLDIMVWRPDGKYWVRQPVAGTALENKADSLKFPLAAASVGGGAVIVGWELSGGRQHPAVWRSTEGVTGWTMTRLPDAGRAGAALSVQCTDATCTAAGWVDGNLALWTLSGTSWTRTKGVPRVPVPQNTALSAPVAVDGHPAEVLNKGHQVVLAETTTRPLTGPAGKVVAAARVGQTLYVATENSLWQADIAP